jgi:hypothetical protein
MNMFQRDGQSIADVIAHNIAPLHQRNTACFNEFGYS